VTSARGLLIGGDWRRSNEILDLRFPYTWREGPKYAIEEMTEERMMVFSP
jgi:hypothetical protein